MVARSEGWCIPRILDAVTSGVSRRIFAAMNKIWDAWVAADGKPARATVQAALATPDYLVEIQAVAAL